MKDVSGHEIKYYRVTYTRNTAKMSSLGRIQATVITTEWQLKSMLYDESRYEYVVISAEYLPNHLPNMSDDYE